MTVQDDSNITWITCPDCGAKIGVVISVGKSQLAITPTTETIPLPSDGIEERLVVSGVDLTLINIEESDECITIRPKKFLGDLWGPINEAIRTLGGGWIREGRDSRWEIRTGNME
jgi:hypothetical protein